MDSRDMGSTGPSVFEVPNFHIKKSACPEIDGTFPNKYSSYLN